MIHHLFKLIWNKKTTHALLILEIWASFLVLFGLASLIIHNVRNYIEPLGFSYENVWAINLANNEDTTAVGEKARTIFRRLQAYPEVESVSRMSDNFPFSSYFNGMGVSYNKTVTQMAFYVADENFARTLSIPLAAGAWYRGADSVSKYRVVVISQKASESLFGKQNPLGKIISDYEGKNGIWKVVGVVNDFKGKGEFKASEPAIFELLKDGDGDRKTMLIHVKPGTDALFEARLVHDITALVKGWSVDVTDLADARKSQHKVTLVPIIIFLIVCSFLLINVALGLFGVLNLSVARRRGEIGLRRALGATEGGILRQFMGEMVVLATFALVLGLLVAGQFFLLNVFDVRAEIYLMAMAGSAVIIYLIVTLCALYPSHLAATIQPAVALHEE